MSIISNSPAMKQDKGTSMTQNPSVGSGSRPTASKVKIDTSAPMDPHELGRAPKGWLR